MATDGESAHSNSSEEHYETTDTEITNDTQTEDDDYQADGDPDPQSEWLESYRHGEDVAFQFRELGMTIGDHLKAANAGIVMRQEAPYNDIPTRQEHNKQQGLIWQDLCAKVAANDSIPKAIFDPPRTYVQVRIARWPQDGHFCCPCDFGDSSHMDCIEVRAVRGSEHGITKDLLLKQIGDAFFGGEDGLGWILGDDDSRPVIDHLNYMMGSSGSGGYLMGHMFAMTRGWLE